MSGGGYLQDLAALVPIRKHPALAAAAVDQHVMPGGPVCMAVNQDATIMGSERLLDLARRYIHDLVRLGLLRDCGLLLHSEGDGPAFRERPLQELALHLRVTHARAESLIGNIVGAQGVSVHQQRAPSEQLDDDRIIQQHHAGCSGEAFPNEKITIAVHQKDPATAVRDLAQVRDDRAVQRLLVIIVADPVVEEIAEDVQRARVARAFAQETEKDPVDPVPIRREVKIGNEQDRGAASIGVRNGFPQ